MSLSRREFVKNSLATAGALAWSSNTLAASSAGDDIRVAVIGVNGRGKAHYNSLRRNVVAMCDIDQKVLAERAAKFKEDFGREVEQIVDYRKLMDRDDIDAVAIATPNHTHALIGIAAAQAGKHVYLEKPVSHNIWEGRQLVASAKLYDVRIQCGTQSRSSAAIKQAVEAVRGGMLGSIKYAIGTCYKPRPSIGELDSPLKIPSHIDYDLWCGPAEKRDLLRSRLHYDWHWDFNTGNGDMGNQGIHQMDIARWFLGEQDLAPRVLSIGGRLGYDDAGDTPNTQISYFDYPTAPLIFETRGLPRDKAGQKRWGSSMDTYRGSGIGVIVQCEKGYVFVPSYHNAIAYDNSGEEIKSWQDNGDTKHFSNWLDAVRAGDSDMLNGSIYDGHVSSSLCQMGGISHQLGEELPRGGHCRTHSRQRVALRFFRADGCSPACQRCRDRWQGGRHHDGPVARIRRRLVAVQRQRRCEHFTKSRIAPAVCCARYRAIGLANRCSTIRVAGFDRRRASARRTGGFASLRPQPPDSDSSQAEPVS